MQASAVAREEAGGCCGYHLIGQFLSRCWSPFASDPKRRLHIVPDTKLVSSVLSGFKRVSIHRYGLYRKVDVNEMVNGVEWRGSGEWQAGGRANKGAEAAFIASLKAKDMGRKWKARSQLEGAEDAEGSSGGDDIVSHMLNTEVHNEAMLQVMRDQMGAVDAKLALLMDQNAKLELLMLAKKT
jgi:hypothetical protein